MGGCPSSNRILSAQRKKSTTPAEKHNETNVTGDYGDASTEPPGAAGTSELHEIILAAPMTEASPMVDYGRQTSMMRATTMEEDTSERSGTSGRNKQRPMHEVMADKHPGCYAKK